MNQLQRFTQVVVLAVIKRGDTILFTRRYEPGTQFHRAWQLPGGGLEFGEAPHETLIREVREELGVSLTKYQLIPYIDSETRGRWQGVFVSYLCTIPDDAVIKLNEEADDLVWQPIDSIAALHPMPGCEEVVRHALNNPITL